MAAQIFLGILGLVVALILFSQWRMSHLSRGLRGQPAPTGARSHPQGVLYYFYSPRCGPCRAMGPVIDRVTETHPGQVVKVDVGEEPQLAAAFRVAGTPTTMLLRDGEIVEVMLGAKSQKRLEALLQGDAPHSQPD